MWKALCTVIEEKYHVKKDVYEHVNTGLRQDGKEPKEIGLLPKPEQNKIIKQLKEEGGFSIRQIERATGISKGIIARCWQLRYVPFWLVLDFFMQ